MSVNSSWFNTSEGVVRWSIQNTSTEIPVVSHTFSEEEYVSHFQNQTDVSGHSEVENGTATAWNTNNLEEGKTREIETLDPFLIFMLTSCFVLSLLICGGNIPVLVSIFVFKSLRTVTNMFIASLAVADLLVGAVVVPLCAINVYLPQLIFGRVIQNEYLCLVRCFVNRCSYGASLLNMGAIALDRYIAVNKPLRYKNLLTTRRALWCIAFSWLYPIVLTCFMFYDRKPNFDESLTECASQVYNRTFNIFVNVNIILFFLIIMLSHIIVGVTATKQRSIHIQRLIMVDNSLAVAYMKESRLVKTMTLVLGLFTMCWLPTIFSALLTSIVKGIWMVYFLRAFQLFLWANSAMNPWIYAFRIKDLSKGMRRVALCRYKRQLIKTISVSTVSFSASR